MKNLLLSLGLVLTLAGASVAQSTTPALTHRSDQILLKMRQVDLLMHILPLVLEPKQLRDLLPPIEKARAQERKIRAAEDAELAKLEAKLDAALKKAYETGEYPERALLSEIHKVTSTMSLRQQVELEAMIDSIYPVVMKTLNEGQRTTMAKSLDPKFFLPDVKSEEITEEDRIRLFIRHVLLSPPAYDILVKLSLRKDP
jgi:predicted house-cleaning noncanonical NTP pyrophosphatase (MazG superfamily)